ncbi:hypothetical protein [Aquipseudomonas alcaligenes]|uniref:Uncharacterized protein n=1 Tax=Aquipseudomonas alcaligenes TaxID=43263 RepID=A0A1N6S8A3_AQUAC|nr:hypothetical protein [Pseudomonas alcaligenes]SIQ37325.1 hypothetical protein SAMN05878282_103424 [Pseudomonas alcaligenes]
MLAKITAFGQEDAIAELQHLGRDVAGEVLADALNHTGNRARQLLRAGMDQAFDRPTSWVKNSIYMKNAKPTEPVVALWIKDGKLGGKGRGFDEWFNPQVEGGERLNKGSEKMLREIGVLPAGRFIVPAAGARLDGNGGISRGHMTQILSGLRAFGLAGSDHNATGSRRSARKGHANAFFVMKRGRTPIGIAERRGQRVQMVLAFVRQPQYRERFRFYDIVRRVAEDDALIETNIDLAVVKALSKRRGGRR